MTAAALAAAHEKLIEEAADDKARAACREDFARLHGQIAELQTSIAATPSGKPIQLHLEGVKRPTFLRALEIIAEGNAGSEAGRDANHALLESIVAAFKIPITEGEISEALDRGEANHLEAELTAPLMAGRDGAAFEDEVAELLERLGYSVDQVGQAGDQGADLVVRRGAIAIAIQCKNWEASVGNGAVQEVIAARDFHGTQHGAVIADGAFTPAARELALRAGIALLDRSAVERLRRGTDVLAAAMRS